MCFLGAEWLQDLARRNFHLHCLIINSPSFWPSFQTVGMAGIHHHVKLLKQRWDACSPFTRLSVTIWPTSSYLASSPLFFHQQCFHALNYSFLTLAFHLELDDFFWFWKSSACFIQEHTRPPSARCYSNSGDALLQYCHPNLQPLWMRFTSHLKRYFNYTRFLISSQTTRLICESVTYQHGSFPFYTLPEDKCLKNLSSYLKNMGRANKTTTVRTNLCRHELPLKGQSLRESKICFSLCDGMFRCC